MKWLVAQWTTEVRWAPVLRSICCLHGPAPSSLIEIPPLLGEGLLLLELALTFASNLQKRMTGGWRGCFVMASVSLFSAEAEERGRETWKPAWDFFLILGEWASWYLHGCLMSIIVDHWLIWPNWLTEPSVVREPNSGLSSQGAKQNTSPPQRTEGELQLSFFFF